MDKKTKWFNYVVYSATMEAQTSRKKKKNPPLLGELEEKTG